MNNIRWLALALLLGGCATYRAHEVRENNTAVLAQMKADLAMCKGNPLLTTHVMRATCMNEVETDAFARLVPPQPILAVRQNALQLRLAEQGDAGQITDGQAAEQMAALVAELQAEERQAAYQQQQLQIQQNAINAQAGAAWGAIGASMLNNAATNLAAPSFAPGYPVVPAGMKSPTMP